MALKALKGGAATWLAEQDEMADEEKGEYTVPYMEDDEEEMDEEMEGKSRELSADQMILVKRAIETLSDLLSVVQGETKGYGKDYEKGGDMSDDEKGGDMSDEQKEGSEYDSLAAAVSNMFDGDIADSLSEAAKAVDDAIDGDDSEALDDAASKFLDVVEDKMGGDMDDDLRKIAKMLADLIEDLGGDDEEEMPSEENVEKKRMCPMCGAPDGECKCGYMARMGEKRMYSDETRAQMAEEGMALPDGSYPIKDKADLENAIQAYGRAKDKEAAKRHIKKRAKELDLEDMLPENWMSEKAEVINVDEMKALLDSFKL